MNATKRAYESYSEVIIKQKASNEEQEYFLSWKQSTFLQLPLVYRFDLVCLTVSQSGLLYMCQDFKSWLSLHLDNF